MSMEEAAAAAKARPRPHSARAALIVPPPTSPKAKR